MKTSRTSITYKEEENALRIVMLSKVGVSEKSNRCSDGTANCGANTICVPIDDENYEVTSLEIIFIEVSSIIFKFKNSV